MVPDGGLGSPAISNLSQPKRVLASPKLGWITIVLLSSLDRYASRRSSTGASSLWALSVVMSNEGTEALLIFRRGDERADHRMLFGDVAKCSAVDLAQPEKEPRDVRIAAQITEILSGHKRSVVFGVDERPVINGIRLHVIVSQPIHHRTSTA